MGFADNPIKVEGLREFQKALKDMDGESQKQLRLVLNEAAEVVASGARRLVPVGKTGKARKSVRAQSTQRVARIVAGGSRAPYYGFLDFGGSVGHGHVPGKGGGAIKRTMLKEGRYLFPTWSRRRPWVYDQLAKGLEKAIENAGMEAS